MRLIAFDLDHTLLKESISFGFGKYLYKQGYFSLWEMLTLVGYYILHKLGLVSVSGIHYAVFRRLFKGRSYDVMAKYAQAYLNERLEELYSPPILAKWNEAKCAQAQTWILSSSPTFLVKPIAEKLGASGYRGTDYALSQEGVLSHVSFVFTAEEKAKQVQKIQKEHGIKKENVIAYSDSHHDIPFLEAAGKAIAVNPDRKLRAWCKHNTSEILITSSSAK